MTAPSPRDAPAGEPHDDGERRRDGRDAHRFSRHWAKWDAAVEGGQRPADFLPAVSDESLAELLASAGRERRYEKDLIAVELQNRLARRKRGLREAAAANAEAHREIEALVEETADAVHETARNVGRSVEEGEPPTAEMAEVALEAGARIDATRDAVVGLGEVGRGLARLKGEAEDAGRAAD